MVRRAGRLGHLVLNRPKALNALTGGMVDTVLRTLREWAEDDAVATVLVSGAGTKGLCAGGDVVGLRAAAVAGHPEVGDAFFAQEYAMNALIAGYPKPYVAFMDGIVLGGGIGISAHGSHRVVTERTRLGMPETGIGFFPDVGGLHLLARAPWGAGRHLGLTAEHCSGADALALGFADHLVDSSRLEELTRALEDTDAEEAIAAVATPADQWPEPPLAAHRHWIEPSYTQATPEEIVAALRSHGDPAAAAAAETILAKSPTSVKVTLEALRRAERMDSVHEVLAQDTTIAHHLIRGHDMAEGIRAQLVDKDRTPRWNPARLEDVDDDAVLAAFAPVTDRD